MSDWKITFVFNQRERGFSETWYLPNKSEAEVFAAAKAVAVSRATMLAQDVVFECLKFSDVDVTGDGFVDTVTRTYAKTSKKGDETGTAPLLRCWNNSKYWRSMTLRGMPDDYIIRNDDGILVVTAEGKDLIDSYMQAVQTNGMCFQATTRIGDGNDGEPILEVIKDDLRTQVTKITSLLPIDTLEKGDEIQIRGCHKSYRALNGIYRLVRNPTTDPETLINTYSVKFVYEKLVAPILGDLADAIIRPVEFDYLAVNSYRLIDVRNRKSGRAFFVPAGRRRNQP